MNKNITNTFLVIAGLLGTAWHVGGTEPPDAQIELYTVSNIGPMILPDTQVIPGEKNGSIKLVGCPGEYVAGSFVVRPGRDMQLKPEATDLNSVSAGTIPATAVDLKIVKCWYQDYGQDRQERLPVRPYNPVWRSGRKALTPELLLNNASLVKVDRQRQDNYAKIIIAGRNGITEEYVCVSSPAGVTDSTRKNYPATLPVKDDSPELEPVDIARGENQQFYLTLHIPENTKAGTFTGIITLKGSGQPERTLNLALRVLPFKLLQPYYISSMNHHSRLDNGRFSDHKLARTETVYRRELLDLKAHGVSNPIISPGYTPELFERMLLIRQELGMSGQPLFYQDYDGEIQQAAFHGKSIEWLKKQVAGKIALAKRYGFTDVYFYGLDEAEGDKLKAQRTAWQAVREAGGKVFVAGRGKEHFDAMGDINDLFREQQYPQRELAALWHGKGNRIVSYNNPQCGVEQPLAYRRNYGLLLWQKDYDGAMDFTYYLPSFGNLWNDFDHKTFKDHNMVYPTVNNVIGTVHWEGYREAVTDIRYLTTLRHYLDRPEVKNGTEAASAAEAEDFLRDLKEREVNVNDIDLDIVRLKIIEYILKLSKPIEVKI